MWENRVEVTIEFRIQCLARTWPIQKTTETGRSTLRANKTWQTVLINYSYSFRHPFLCKISNQGVKTQTYGISSILFKSGSEPSIVWYFPVHRSSTKGRRAWNRNTPKYGNFRNYGDSLSTTLWAPSLFCWFLRQVLTTWSFMNFFARARERPGSVE